MREYKKHRVDGGIMSFYKSTMIAWALSLSVSAPNYGLMAIVDMASASTVPLSLKDIFPFYSAEKIILRRSDLLYH